MRAGPSLPLAEVAEREPVSVGTDADLPEVARMMTDYNLVMLPVVDGDGTAVGVVTVDDVLELTLPTGWRRALGLVRDWPPSRALHLLTAAGAERPAMLGSAPRTSQATSERRPAWTRPAAKYPAGHAPAGSSRCPELGSAPSARGDPCPDADRSACRRARRGRRARQSPRARKGGNPK